MCGIVGWAGAHPSQEFPRETLLRAARALAHRGPDDENFYLEPGMAFGHRRLAILDPTQGRQPWVSRSGRYVLTYNGEIYDAPVWRRRLEREGIPFRTHCDTEVLAALLDWKGFRLLEEACPSGIFAFGAWDRDTRRLLLVRDPIGVKPLYFRIDPTGISFASEIKALRQIPNLPWDVDPQALDEYLERNAISAPRTIWKQVRKLEPGTALVYEAGNSTLQRYWQPDVTPRATPWEEAVRQSRRLVRGAVRRQLQSDVPVGVFLSAGVDSAVVLEGVRRAHPEAAVRAYCLGFAEASYDERAGARSTARALGVELVELEQCEGIEDTVQAVGRHLDEPLGDSSAVATWQLCQAAAAHVKVALAGDGGDEIFGGYETYRAELMAQWLDRTGLTPLAGVMAPILTALPVPSRKGSPLLKATRFLTRVAGERATRHRRWKEIFSPGERAHLYQPDWARTVRPRRFDPPAGMDALNSAMYQDLTDYLPNTLLHKVDLCSMAHGLEVRVPLLDVQVVRTLLRLPGAYKVGLRERKRLLRAGYGRGPLAPVFTRPKQGFSIPAGDWLRGRLRGLFHDALTTAKFRNAGILDGREVLRHALLHQDRRVDGSQKLWGVLMLALWMAGT